MTIPRATYRLQFHAGFTLREALDCVPYLSELGVSHLYASPLLMARPGSTHGYDVCQPTRLNPELGTEAEFQALLRTLRQRGMGLVLDIVPNHQGIGGRANPWWWDVLQHGRQSRYADYFDIDWESPDGDGRGKIVLPVLDDALERVLERRELAVVQENDEVVLRYFDHRFPLSPASLKRQDAVVAVPTELNADPSAMAQLLDQQHYDLVGWRDGDRRLNYRRFFLITDLAGIRVELPHVFADVHERIVDWHRRGWLDGLRVDHPDGLRDPRGYLERLSGAVPGAWIVVEKILGKDELLPREWPVAGTTGYDYLARVLGLFVDPASESSLSRFHQEFTGERRTFAEVVNEKKRWVLQERFRPEVARLTRLLREIAAGGEDSASLTNEQLQEALVELIVCWPVYRTYIRADEDSGTGTGPHDPADIAVVEDALTQARQHRPELENALDFLSTVLFGRVRRAGAGDWVMRFQQLTGPAMAKGVEDTAFYCFNRFIALNEVGGAPEQFGLSVGEYHEACTVSRQKWPHGMLATSTHDTKRGEDSRARLALLSEVPEKWELAVRQWSILNERHRRRGWPDRSAEYQFYQTLVGAWPLSTERALAYVEKAAREAARYTNWVDPNADYENALAHFVRQALSDPVFVRSFEQFLTPLIGAGQVNALAQVLLKLTTPGVPDIYQGTDLWDLSLVDPDNRRPVDFGMRRNALQEIGRRIQGGELSAVARELLASCTDGRIKMFVIQRALQYRRQRERLFSEGEYMPLAVTGTKASHVCSFARSWEGATAIVAVPRLILGLTGDHHFEPRGVEFWGDTSLILPRGYAARLVRNCFTGESQIPHEDGAHVSLRVAELFARFPVALCDLPEQ